MKCAIKKNMEHKIIKAIVERLIKEGKIR